MRNGAGASSTSFWCRRCSEQSRVPTTTTLPCWSASTCASTCRGLVQVPLDEALAPAERRDRLAGRGLEQRWDLLKRAGDLQAPPAAAERRLDGDREAVLLGECHDLLGTADRVGRAGHERRAGALGDVPRGHLVTQVPDGLRRGADPGQAGVDDGLGELGVLRQKAVAGVHSIRAALARRRREACRFAGTSRRRCRRRARRPRRRAARAARPGPSRRIRRRWPGRHRGRRV